MLSRLTVGQSVDRYSIKCVGRLTLDQVCWSILGRLSTGIVADILIDISVDTSIHTPQKIHDHNTDLPGSVCNVTSFFLKTSKISFTLKVGKWENCIVSTCTRLCSKKIVGSPQDQTDKGFGSMMTITILNSSAKANISLPANNPKNYICNKVQCLGPLSLAIDPMQKWLLD